MKRNLTLIFIFLLSLSACRPQENQAASEQDAASLIMTAAAATAEAMGITLEPAEPTQPANPPTLTPAPTETPAYFVPAIVLSGNLNLRAGPSTFFEILRAFPEGSQLTTLEMTADGAWIKVSANDGAQGWVFASFLDLSALEAALPIADWPMENTIYGTVLDTDGEPINAARIAASIETEQGEQRAETASTRDGNFAIHVPAGLNGPFNLEIVSINCGSRVAETQPDGSCTAPDHFALNWRQTVYLPQTQPVRFTYEEGAAFLEGQVVYQDGNGASQILVRATRQSDGAQSEYVTPQGGEFRLPLGEGDWEVVAVRFMQDGTPLVSKTYSYQISEPGQELEPLTIPYIEIINRN